MCVCDLIILKYLKSVNQGAVKEVLFPLGKESELPCDVVIIMTSTAAGLNGNDFPINV